jgi:hypothetical protein
MDFNGDDIKKAGSFIIEGEIAGMKRSKVEKVVSAIVFLSLLASIIYIIIRIIMVPGGVPERQRTPGKRIYTDAVAMRPWRISHVPAGNNIQKVQHTDSKRYAYHVYHISILRNLPW